MTILKLEDYDISPELGFLPTSSFAKVQLPSSFRSLVETATLVPKWMTTGRIRKAIANLPEVDVEKATMNEIQLRRLMQIYSYLTHAYVWGEPTTIKVLPRNLAVPFYTIARQLGRPPVLSYRLVR